MNYVKAYMDIRPILSKHFTKASPVRTMKVWKPAHSKHVQFVIS